jgi:hypothetical protein
MFGFLVLETFYNCVGCIASGDRMILKDVIAVVFKIMSLPSTM